MLRNANPDAEHRCFIAIPSMRSIGGSLAFGAGG